MWFMTELYLFLVGLVQHEQVHMYELACAAKAPKFSWIGFSYMFGFILIFLSFIYNLWFYYSDLLLLSNTFQLVKVCFPNPVATIRLKEIRKYWNEFRREEDKSIISWEGLLKADLRHFSMTKCQPGYWSPLANHIPAIVSVSPPPPLPLPQALKYLTSLLTQTKSPDDSNMLHVFRFQNILQTRLNS